jgi:hypothetical protein
MSAVATAWTTTWWPTCGRRPGHLPRRQTAADTSMATGTSLTPCAGHQPFGRRSFRKQRTVNPLIVPARYNFLYSSSRPPSAAAADWDPDEPRRHSSQKVPSQIQWRTMNRREAALTQRGLAIVAAHTNGDHAGRDTLIEQFIDEYEFQRLADAFIYTALVGIELAATARSVQFRAALNDIRPDPEAVLFPEVSVPWDEAKWLAEHVKYGGDDIQLSASMMDQPGAVNGSFQLAVSALQALEMLPHFGGQTAGQLASLLLTNLAAGAGVDDGEE